MADEDPGNKINYVISDSDLNLLPLYSYRKRDNVVPLWSIQNTGGGPEYFEFEVHRRELEGDDVDETSDIGYHLSARRQPSVTNVPQPSTSGLNSNLKTKELTPRIEVDIQSEINKVDTNLTVKDASQSQNVQVGKDKNKSDSTEVETTAKSDTGFYICVCQEIVNKDPLDIKNHLNTYKHTMFMKEKKTTELSRNKIYFCNICKINVNRNPNDIKKHNDSNVHKINFTRMLLNNNIQTKDGNVFFCDMCNLNFNKHSVASHVERETHKILLNHNNATDRPT